MNTIIKILEENRLYDDDFKNVYTNKIQKFIDDYKINKGSKNKLPNGMKRNKDGFLILEDEPYIISDLKTDGRNAAFWMLLSNGSRILLKDVDEVEIQNELLFKYLCKWLDIPCANNDAAIFEGSPYLLSPSLLGIDEYLFNYYNLDRTSDIKIDKLLSDASKIGQDFFLKKTLTVDMLSANQDRFPKNFRVIKSPKQIRICPLFDNGILEINSGKMRVLKLPVINGSLSHDDLINYLMQDIVYKKWCLKKIISRDMPNLKEQIQNDKGIYIDDDVFDSFNKSINNGKAIILDSYKYN